MNNLSSHQKKARPELHLDSQQEEEIRIYADMIGMKISRLVSEIILDNLTLLWMDKYANQSMAIICEKPAVHD